MKRGEVRQMGYERRGERERKEIGLGVSSQLLETLSEAEF